MTIAISIDSDNLQLISSGFLFAKPNKPITMTVLINNEKIVSVMLYIHSELHPEGKSMVRHISDDGTADEWHIFESNDGEDGYTPIPVPIMCFEDDDIKKTIYLQLHTQKLRNGLYEVKYVWWEGQPFTRKKFI